MDKDKYKRWFIEYCDGFYESEEKHNENYRLKKEHTFKVCDNITTIASSEDVPKSLIDTAWLCGLFHDLGRFPQYRQYRTFKDSVSVNHGLLSAEILKESGLRHDFDERQFTIITESVKYHNAYSIPSEIKDQDTLFCLKALRDADKIDIWRIFIELYSNDTEGRPSAVGLGLLENRDCSEELIKGIRDGRILKLTEVKTVDEFKILQLSWLFDLNFTESFRIFHKRGYMKCYTKLLPDRQDIKEILDFLEDYIAKKL